MDITLDVTGFYFSKTVTMPNATASVLDVMHEVQRTTSGADPEFTFKPDQNDQFVSTISVHYKGATVPKSRQRKRDTSGNLIPITNNSDARKQGLYSYTDNLRLFDLDGDVRAVLAWQYYIFRGKTLVSGRQPNEGEEVRVIVPAGSSNLKVGATQLQHNDRIVWRLVAIAGLEDVIASGRAEMDEASFEAMNLKQFIDAVSAVK